MLLVFKERLDLSRDHACLAPTRKFALLGRILRGGLIGVAMRRMRLHTKDTVTAGSSSKPLFTEWVDTESRAICAETLQQFRGYVEAELGERVDLNNGDDYSMVLGLPQHHGLPTPLLDLTSSPYVGAFFAFTDALEFNKARPDATHVRVYGFTRAFLTGTSSATVTLPYFKPYTSSLSISPRKNRRLYAQQGQFLVTNFADIETHICSIEQNANTKCLIAADVPTSFAVEALEDLAFMGLTAGTMFPGLDGVCRMMKHAMSFKAR